MVRFFGPTKVVESVGQGWCALDVSLDISLLGLLRVFTNCLASAQVTKWSELKRFLSDFAAHCPTAIARSAMGLNFAAAGASTKPLGWVPSRSMLEAALSLPSNLCPEVASFMEQTVILVSFSSHVICQGLLATMPLRRASGWDACWKDCPLIHLS